MTLTIYKRNTKDRNCLIIIDGEVRGTLPDSILRTLSLSEVRDMVIDAAIHAGIEAELLSRCRTKLLDYLSQAEHSAFQCRQMLSRQRFAPAIQDLCLQEAMEHNYLNDKRFAELYITSMIERGESVRSIRFKLSQQKIKPEIVSSLLQELYPSEDQRVVIRREIDRLEQRFGDLEQKKRREKILTHLYRKGFDLDLCRDLLYN